MRTIAFDDGERFQLHGEYLRVFFPAAEVVVTREIPETGKEDMDFKRIEPRGTYAVRLYR